MRQKGLSLGKVAGFCGVTRKTILRWVKEGMIDSFVLPSGHHRVLPSIVIKFLQQHGMPVPEELKGLEKPRVLLAEDDEDIRRLVRRTLGEEYYITEVSNGIEACLSMGQNPPDLLILDIKMPKMDGVDVCREVRRDPVLSSMGILIISAYLDDEVEEQIDGLIDGCLAKPFTNLQLVDMCEKILDAK
jgi:CheY-like chemotaxis protein